MKLEKYLKLKGFSYRKFSKLICVDHSAIFRYAKGTATPSLKVALKICNATKGKVDIRSLVCK